MINQTNAQGQMVYRSYYSIMIDQTTLQKDPIILSLLLLLFFLFFYCVGSITATPIVTAIDQLLAAIFEVAANKYDLLFFSIFLLCRINSGDPNCRRY
jgi:Trk-type K+ transport system membrane component